MSRYELTPKPDILEKHPGVIVAVGWQGFPDTNNSGAWFLQVVVIDDTGRPVEWMFGETYEDAFFTSPAQVVVAAKDYAIVEAGLAEMLLDDKSRETRPNKA